MPLLQYVWSLSANGQVIILVCILYFMFHVEDASIIIIIKNDSI